jgi:hypothetical protein
MEGITTCAGNVARMEEVRSPRIFLPEETDHVDGLDVGGRI